MMISDVRLYQASKQCSGRESINSQHFYCSKQNLRLLKANNSVHIICLRVKLEIKISTGNIIMENQEKIKGMPESAITRDIGSSDPLK